MAYHVEHLKHKSFHFLKDQKSLQCLQKWSLSSGLHVSGWAFNEPYQPLKVQDLVSSLLKQAQQLEEPLPKIQFGSYSVEQVPCTITSLEIFDRLLDPANGIVNRSGDGGIRGCFEETINDFPVNDELRQMLLNDVSDVHSLYSNQERSELLFLLLKHLVLGGQLCQYEDTIHPYIDVTLVIYKSLLNVQKNRDNGEVQIRSKCFRVSNCEEKIQDFIYVIIDPSLREATVFSHTF